MNLKKTDWEALDNRADNQADNQADNRADNWVDDVNEKKMCLFKRKKMRMID